MEELIFFGIIIALSIIDSIARRAKARRAGRAPESESSSQQPDRGGARTGTPQRRAPTYEPVSTYDEQPTYDSEWRGGEVATYDDVATATTEADEGPSAPSAGMIPQDLWEEIAGLARGRAEPTPAERPSRGPRPTPAPRPSRSPEPSVRRRIERTERMRPREPVRAPPAPVPSADLHPIHLTHAQFGTDPSERVVLQSSARRPSRSAANADVRAVRAQLGGDQHALRRAVIVREVLGRPAALREDRLEELLER